MDKGAFTDCCQLPSLVSLDITGAHIGRVAMRLQGSGGLGVRQLHCGKIFS